MITDSKEHTASNIYQDVIKSFQGNMNEATSEIIQTFERASNEVRDSVATEFEKKPWLYVTSLLGTGIVIGFFLSDTLKSRQADDQVKVLRG